MRVAPFAGAWIEIFAIGIASLNVIVAPFAGAWIEITIFELTIGEQEVAPFAGAWIEINERKQRCLQTGSLRSPERGLK